MIDSQKLYRFLNACAGEWRNSILICCTSCPYNEHICSGYFLTADRDGAPILYPVALFQKYCKETVDTDECIGKLSRQSFEALYNRWLLWKVTKPQQCSILQVLRSENQTDTAL